MRGSNIKNIYIIDGIELSIKELNINQLLLIEKFENRVIYNDFRNKIIEQKGEDVICSIKVIVSSMML